MQLPNLQEVFNYFTFQNYKTIQLCNNQKCCRKSKRGTLMHKIYKENVYCNMIYNKRKPKERKANAK